MYKIKLKSARFFSYHGVFFQEQILGGWYEVDVEVSGDFSVASESDNIKDTVNYQVLYDLVKHQMDCNQKLLETVLDNIYRAIRAKYSSIDTVEIKLRKLNPPVGGQATYSEVTLRK